MLDIIKDKTARQISVVGQQYRQALVATVQREIGGTIAAIIS
jgi:hypothetical protein